MGPLGHWLLCEWGEMVLGKAILESKTVCKHKSGFRELIGPGEERLPWQISSVPEALLNKTARVGRALASSCEATIPERAG